MYMTLAALGQNLELKLEILARVIKHVFVFLALLVMWCLKLLEDCIVMPRVWCCDLGFLPKVT